MMMDGLRAAAVLVISSTALGLGGCTAGTPDSTPGSTTAASETAGATATTGSQGADGATGPAGERGAPGASGMDGSDGAQGLPGAKGATGGPGPTGAHGASGLSSLVNVTNLPVGDVHCPGGGVKIETGIDTDRDGTLQPSEVDQTTYSCEPVARKRVVFVTSQTFDGNLGGIAGADAKCMAAAGASPALAGKTFRAWVSTSSSSPATSFTSDGSFVTVGGASLDDSFNNIRQGTLMTKITTETGASVSVPVWTGTDENGYNEEGFDCNGWTDASASAESTRSTTDVIQWYWASSETKTCDQQGALYCFEQ
jgi:hypothetical protein